MNLRAKPQTLYDLENGSTSVKDGSLTTGYYITSTKWAAWLNDYRARDQAFLELNTARWSVPGPNNMLWYMCRTKAGGNTAPETLADV